MVVRIDIDPSFRLNSQGGIFTKTGDDAILQQIKDIIFTQRGELLFDPDTGCNIGDFLHGSVNKLNAMNIKDIIFNNLRNRIEDIIITSDDIIVDVDRDAEEYLVIIKYTENQLDEEIEINFSIKIIR